MAVYLFYFTCVLNLPHFLYRTITEPKTRTTTNKEMIAELLREQTIVWVAKLPDNVTNDLLQGGDIKPDSGCFNPFTAYVKYTANKLLVSCL